jgi:hypothetical protein
MESDLVAKVFKGVEELMPSLGKGKVVDIAYLSQADANELSKLFEATGKYHVKLDPPQIDTRFENLNPTVYMQVGRKE